MKNKTTIATTDIEFSLDHINNEPHLIMKIKGISKATYIGHSDNKWKNPKVVEAIIPVWAIEWINRELKKTIAKHISCEQNKIKSLEKSFTQPLNQGQ